jgi:penicillin amidase
MSTPTPSESIPNNASEPTRGALPNARLYSAIARLRRSQTHRPRLRILSRLLLAIAVLALIISARRNHFAALLPCTQIYRRSTANSISTACPPRSPSRAMATVCPRSTLPTLTTCSSRRAYITAQDRLFQMDALRRHAAGELAEILGPSLVEHDRLQRYLRTARRRPTAPLAVIAQTISSTS